MASDHSGFLAGLTKLTIPGYIALAISIIAVRWVVRGTIRVYFHPLSHFPGPKLSAFTRLPHLSALYNGRLPKYIALIHEQYGEVVRISPDELSFLHADAWRDIYGHGPKEGPGKAPPKNWLRYGKSINGSRPIITIRDNAEHARTRKIFAPAFSDRALTQQAPLFTKYADQLVSNLNEGSKKGEKIDMVRMYNFTTFDVMGDLTFGEPLHMLDNAEYDPWVKIVFHNVKRGLQLSLIYNYYPLVADVFRFFLHKTFAKLQYEHFAHATTRVTKRLEKGRASDGVDLWTLVLESEEKGKGGLTRGEMDSNSSLFMVAGTETTATLLAGLTYLLLTNVDKLGMLTKEIRGTFKGSDEISMDVLQGLPYLNACMKEALRRYPPVAAGLPHLTPKEGSTICGRFVPPGISVSAHHLPMYESPTMFKDPLEFVPERWMGDEKYKDDQHAALQPFSVGSRDCLGKNMAYHEMRLVLSKVLYNFDLELCPESKDWIDQKIFTLWQKKPLMVKLTPAGA